MPPGCLKKNWKDTSFSQFKVEFESVTAQGSYCL